MERKAGFREMAAARGRLMLQGGGALGAVGLRAGDIVHIVNVRAEAAEKAELIAVREGGAAVFGGGAIRGGRAPGVGVNHIFGLPVKTRHSPQHETGLEFGRHFINLQVVMDF
jgi:hypothetical protein